MNRLRFSLALAILAAPFAASADVTISEIMYDLSGPDTGREWVEIQNGSSAAVDISGWKFFENGANHTLVLSRGADVLEPNGFAVIADNPDRFLLDWPNYSGALFDSSFSLSNTGESLALKNGDAVVVQANYDSSLGAAGDGNSLQFSSGKWLAANPTPGAVNATAQAQTSSNPTSTGTEPVPQAPADSAFAPALVPRIFADIESAESGVVGADVLFQGKGWGLKSEPLPDARYSWNFGDGQIKEGRSVLHAYAFPGDYVVVLEVVSAEFEAVARQSLKIVPAKIFLDEFLPGSDGYVSILNESGLELDLSYWRLRSAEANFELPKNSILPDGKKLIIKNSITGILESNEIDLLYPNGFMAVSFSPKVAAALPPAAKSASKSSAVSNRKPTASLAAAALAKDEAGQNNSAEPAKANLADTEGATKTVALKWYLLLFALIGASAAVFLVGRKPAEIKTEGESGEKSGDLKEEAKTYRLIEDESGEAE